MATLIDLRLADWLASDDTGSSSKAIMLWMAAGKVADKWGPDTPSDAGDLGRCMRLLERVPEWKPRMAEMADAGGLWPTFSMRWPEITAIYLAECGGKVPAKDDRIDCPRTYAFLKQVRDEAYAKDRPGFTEIRMSETMIVRFGK